MPETSASASVRITSTVISAEQIGQKLRVLASRSSEKGEPLSARNPRTTRKNSIWIYSLPQDAGMIELIEKAMAFCEAQSEFFISNKDEIEVDISCMYVQTNQGGFSIDPEIMRRLSKLNIALTFDIYFDELGE